MGPETARWGGGLPLEGVVAENFVPALESLSSLGFEERNLGCPGNFAGMSRTPGGVQKVCAKKLRFSRIFINFEPSDFVADFVAGFFLVLWAKVPRKILQENPRQILQNLYDKNPRQFSAPLQAKMDQNGPLWSREC